MRPVSGARPFLCVVAAVTLLGTGCSAQRVAAPSASASAPAVARHDTPARGPVRAAPRPVRRPPPALMRGISVVLTRDAAGTPVAAVLHVDQRFARIAWHPGSVVPGGTGWPSPNYLSGPELQTVAATFNGGFTNAASRGGVRAGSRSQGVLRTGAASFVVDRAGRADIVRWGPAQLSGAVVVRQNLDLLVDQGRPAATVGQDDTLVWGKGLHHRHATWRTAAGVTRSGDLVIVVASAATTRQLAGYVLAAGAVRAMELDINPQFSCLMTYRHVGTAVVADNVLSHQQGSPSRYLSPSLRDFFSVRPR